LKKLPWLMAGMLLAGSMGLVQEMPPLQDPVVTQDSTALGPVLQDSVELRPVLLVPGWMGRAVDLMALKERLVRDGWPEEWVFPLEFEDPVGSSDSHAKELEGAIQAFLEETGVAELDIVAHSMGGLAVWILLQEKGALLPINRVAFLATPFQGTVTAHLAWGEGGPEMVPGSEFLKELERGGWPQVWVTSLAIRTPLDLTVLPGFDAPLLEIGHQVICCPTHQGLLDHEDTYQVVRDFLLHGKKEEGEGLLP
jgi:triacylglycerol lipase